MKKQEFAFMVKLTKLLLQSYQPAMHKAVFWEVEFRLLLLENLKPLRTAFKGKVDTNRPQREVYFLELRSQQIPHVRLA